MIELSGKKVWIYFDDHSGNHRVAKKEGLVLQDSERRIIIRNTAGYTEVIPYFRIIRVIESYICLLQYWKQVQETYRNLKVSELKIRDLENWKPQLAIAKVIGGDVYSEILSFISSIRTSLTRKPRSLAADSI